MATGGKGGDDGKAAKDAADKKVEKAKDEAEKKVKEATEKKDKSAKESDKKAADATANAAKKGKQAEKAAPGNSSCCRPPAKVSLKDSKPCDCTKKPPAPEALAQEAISQEATVK